MNFDIDKATVSDHNDTAHAIDSMVMDQAADSKETRWSNPDASKYWGIFNTHGDFKSAALMKAIWNTGKGWTTKDKKTQVILERIDGWGKEGFSDILFNMEVCRSVYGDAYAEIIRDEESKEILNLKVLDPAQMVHVVNEKGRIQGFEFMGNTDKYGRRKVVAKFKPNEIFYLANNRIGNQIHGISDIKALEKTILADDKSFDEMEEIISHQARPFIIWKMKTDDQAEINSFITKVESVQSTSKSKGLFIPDDENLLTWEVVQVNPSSILMEWRNETRNRFYRQLGLPLVLFGASGSTESGGKMETFGHEVHWQHNQRYLERQVWEQLGHMIDMISPQTLLDNLQTDEAKDGNQGLELQQNDLTAGKGR